MGGMYDLASPRQNYMRSAGHLGWAFPAGLGAKCACPDRPVVTFTGDAGFWYHIAEVETAVRWKINAVTVVNNNGSGNQSKRGFDRVYGGTQTEGGRTLWTFNKMNFARLAEDMGALGIRVEHASTFPAALAHALAANRPAVIDVVTDIDALAPTAVSRRRWPCLLPLAMQQKLRPGSRSGSSRATRSNASSLPGGRAESLSPLLAPRA